MNIESIRARLVAWPPESIGGIEPLAQFARQAQRDVEWLLKEVERLQSELAMFERCPYCENEGKIHVAVNESNSMVEADHVWALINGAEVWHRLRAGASHA